MSGRFGLRPFCNLAESLLHEIFFNPKQNHIWPQIKLPHFFLATIKIGELKMQKKVILFAECKKMLHFCNVKYKNPSN